MFAGMPDFNQSLEMMKTMWGNVAPNADGSASQGFTMPGTGTSNPFGIPTMNVEDLDKRISELKHVENWLNLNLNVVKTTIQGLEVQRATLAALHAFSDNLKAKTEEFTSESKKSKTKKTASASSENDPMSAAGGMAMDMMNNMAQSMSEAMASIPGLGDAIASTPSKKTTASKTAKPRQSRARASSARRAKGD
jgi:hypothetical protein